MGCTKRRTVLLKRLPIAGLGVWVVGPLAVPAGRQADGLLGSSRLAGQLAGWWLLGPAGWLADYLASWVTGRPARQTSFGSAPRLAGWLASWLTGWPVSSLGRLAVCVAAWHTLALARIPAVDRTWIARGPR